MIEERKTHYSDTKYCDRIEEDILVQQMRVPGDTVVVQCKYVNRGNCDMDTSNPRACLLNSKLINVIRS